MTDQLNEQKESPLNAFTEAIQTITRKSLSGSSDDDSGSVGLGRLLLDAFKSCFVQIKNPVNFLTSAPYQSFTDDLRQKLTNEEKSVRDLIADGIRVTAVATPCDLNGMIFPDKYLDDTQNTLYPYFRIFYSNPEDNRERCLGFENLKPAAYLSVLPEEIVRECSFTVQYGKFVPEDESDKNLTQSEQDLKYILQETARIYKNLQELMKERMK